MKMFFNELQIALFMAASIAWLEKLAQGLRTQGRPMPAADLQKAIDVLQMLQSEYELRKITRTRTRL